MTGINDLDALLKSMKPKHIEGEFVFCTVSEDKFSVLSIKPLLIFREDSGITLILEKNMAEENAIPYNGVWNLITLTVHSDLEAVGFLAAITEKLAKAGISVNAVSAYYHDHLFVPVDKAQEAVKILESFR